MLTLVVSMLGAPAPAAAPAVANAAPADAEPVAAHDDAPADAHVLKYEMKRLDGTPEKLEKYRGKVVMIVNTASKCGLTPQYKALEAMYREYKDRGFVILGFPANNFAGQEPGTNKEIAEFCTGKYDVTFPMFEKISVKGDDTHPLYKQLAALPAPLGGEPKWNFTKFVLNREGEVVARFEPRTRPESKKVRAKIEALLEEG
ncbi:MAG TPA: glutathione peroxidase [Phycisphaerales bacterium]|nr:glutathione peroxidase [Phycisphaerales bacterium]